MGRSFYRPSSENTAEGTYYHPPSDSWFSMIRRDGQYFQRRHQLDAAGKPVHSMEKRIDYVMGSGNRARTYLHRTPANTLIELPLGWYSEKGGYLAMNPGYDRPNHDGFRRPITYDCMFCHNAYPTIPAGHEQPFAQAVYQGPLPEGIDCQRCHGPGARHVQLAGAAGARKAEIRAAIVNPARLTSERQMEICMACHLESTSSPLPNAIQRYHRGPFSFRPGEALGGFLLNFDHAPGSGREDKFEIVNAAYRLRRSACFLKSAGRMTCTTCHNPHDAPRGAAAEKQYTAACRQCHSSGEHVKQSGCADCHMPKRRTEDVIHAVATDHYIQRRKPPGDLLGERQEHQDTYRGPVVLYYPEKLAPTPENELYLAVAQVKQGSNLKAGVVQLTAALAKYAPARAEFYFELAEALENDGQVSKAIPVYREALRRNPKFPPALRRLGTALRKSGNAAEAADVLRRTVAIFPSDAVAWHELGLAYQEMRRTAEAVAAIAKALEYDPDLPEAHNNLGTIRIAQGDRAGAEAAFREAVRIRTDYADAHGNLASLLSAAGRVEEARPEFEAALRLRPRDAATRFSYAMMLGRTKRYDEAQRQLEEAVADDPNFADAQRVLGDLLMAKGRVPDAIARYREAVRAQPDSGRAHLALAAALLATGDKSGAKAHLEKAAGDPETRAEALETLRRPH